MPLYSNAAIIIIIFFFFYDKKFVLFLRQILL